MPCIDSAVFSITIQPRDGWDLPVQRKFGDLLHIWKENILRYFAVTEPNQRGGRHFHIAIEFTYMDKADNLKKRILTAIPEFKATPEERKRTCVVHAHHSFNGLAGGYCQKDDHVIIWRHNVTDTDLGEGKKERDDAIEKRRKIEFSWETYVSTVLKTYTELNNERFLGLKDLAQYEAINAYLISHGYTGVFKHLVMARRTLVPYWKSFVVNAASPPVVELECVNCAELFPDEQLRKGLCPQCNED